MSMRFRKRIREESSENVTNELWTFILDHRLPQQIEIYTRRRLTIKRSRKFDFDRHSHSMAETRNGTEVQRTNNVPALIDDAEFGDGQHDQFFRSGALKARPRFDFVPLCLERERDVTL